MHARQPALKHHPLASAPQIASSRLLTPIFIVFYPHIVRVSWPHFRLAGLPSVLWRPARPNTSSPCPSSLLSCTPDPPTTSTSRPAHRSRSTMVSSHQPRHRVAARARTGCRRVHSTCPDVFSNALKLMPTAGQPNTKPLQNKARDLHLLTA